MAVHSCVYAYRKRKLTGADGSCRELTGAHGRSQELTGPDGSSRELTAAPVSSRQLSLSVHTYTPLCTAMDSGCQIRRQSFFNFCIFVLIVLGVLTSIPAKTVMFLLVLQQQLKNSPKTTSNSCI